MGLKTVVCAMVNYCYCSLVIVTLIIVLSIKVLFLPVADQWLEYSWTFFRSSNLTSLAAMKTSESMNDTLNSKLIAITFFFLAASTTNGNGVIEADKSIAALYYYAIFEKFWFSLEEIVFCLKLIQVVLNDRLGKKVRVKCNEDDTIGDLKKLVAAQNGTRADKIRIQKWYTIYKDHITLKDYEIHDGMGLELYYN
ncbi:uncharacterized protein LOC111301865 [Durio zibethinus]|uniref:Uncharacterized protein LOC111301865 n=1 Tax=Durio zibethinus TaxID=66656 RepID=A0A6P5ZLC2_DURZI|nr:uncharacterized protein LOC111301865 [Durio zibethinus]